MSKAGKADEAEGVRLGTSGANDTKNGDRKPPKKESGVPGRRVTTVILICHQQDQDLQRYYST